MIKKYKKDTMKSGIKSKIYLGQNLIVNQYIMINTLKLK